MQQGPQKPEVSIRPQMLADNVLGSMVIENGRECNQAQNT
jgi:hypothetical protein